MQYGDGEAGLVEQLSLLKAINTRLTDENDLREFATDNGHKSGGVSLCWELDETDKRSSEDDLLDEQDDIGDLEHVDPTFMMVGNIIQTPSNSSSARNTP